MPAHHFTGTRGRAVDSTSAARIASNLVRVATLIGLLVLRDCLTILGSITGRQRCDVAARSAERKSGTAWRANSLASASLALGTLPHRRSRLESSLDVPTVRHTQPTPAATASSSARHASCSAYLPS